VKKGDTILKSYKVKEVNKNYVVLLDTVTGVEVQLELSGADLATQQPQQQSPRQQPPTQTLPQQMRPLPAPTPVR
jgi:hypothetical protein